MVARSMGLRDALEVAEVAFRSANDHVALRSPLFSTNPLRRWVVSSRIRFLGSEIQSRANTALGLDFGPGFGVLLPYLSERHTKVLSVDVDPDCIRSARLYASLAGLSNVEFQQVSGGSELTHVEDGSVDTIVAADVLEHLPHSVKVILEFRRVLSPSGFLFVSIPTENWMYRMFENDDAGHLYHDRTGYTDLREQLLAQFQIVKERSVLGLFGLFVLRNRRT